MTYRHFTRPNSTGWTTRHWRRWAVDQGLLLDVRADIPEGVCSVCWGGTPKTYDRGIMVETEDGVFTPAIERVRWPTCFACNNFPGIAGVLPVSYSVDSRLESAIWRAKNEEYYRWLNIPLAAVLHDFLTQHLACIEDRWGPIDIIASIPSHPDTRGGWDHMQYLLDRVRQWPAADRWERSLLEKARLSPAGDRRRDQPSDDLFQLTHQAPAVVGKRVLLLDDTYTTGGTLRSAGLTILTAGGHAPVVVTIGRQVRTDNYGLHIVQDAVTRDPLFSIHRCAIHA